MVSKQCVNVLEVSSLLAMEEVSSLFAKFVPVTFSHAISVKLDDMNLLWKQQVLAIRGLKLGSFIENGNSTPPKFLLVHEEYLGNINLAFFDWDQ